MTDIENKTQPRLQLLSISKSFPGVLANDHIDLSVSPKEIHALLGENGAGKSTLMKIIYGLIKPDEGQIIWEGKPTSISSPKHARSLGIGMVFQHFSLFDSLTIAENISLALDYPHNLSELSKDIERVSQKYGLPLKADQRVFSLSIGEKQRVEIVRCLLQEPKLLIMDEPTAVLSPDEAEQLFVALRQIAQEGCSVLYISHRLDEIRQICSHATILRMGKVVGTADPKTETAHSLAQMMVGHDIENSIDRQNHDFDDIYLSVSNLNMASPLAFGTDLKHINFTVRSGEILGIAGVAGNGQNELLMALSGEYLLPDAASIQIMGENAAQKPPATRRKLGLSYVSEERLGHSTVPEMSLSENSLLSGYARRNLIKKGLIRQKRIQAYAEKVIKLFNVKTKGRSASANSLSGGNLQKFILGREIMQKPKLLIAAQPTWGIDHASQAAIHQEIIQLRNEGAAILIFSQDLQELFALSDHIAVMNKGKLSEAKETHHINMRSVGLMMGGIIEGEEQTL